MSDFKRFVIVFLFVATGIISVAISGLQYVNDVNSNVTYFETYGNPQETHNYVGDDICTTAPFSSLRPFKFSCSNGYECDSFCGYGQANTAYRISVAVVTFLFGVLLFFKSLVEKYDRYVYWSMFALAIIWFTVTVADITALVNSTDACHTMWETWYAYAKLECDNSTYGVTIAIDVIACILVLGSWILQAQVLNAASAGAGTGATTATTSNNPSAVRNSMNGSVTKLSASGADF